MKKVRIIEIGASSLLDFDFAEHPLVKDKYDIHWGKYYRKNKPKYATSQHELIRATNSSTMFRAVLRNSDAVIFSIGNKGPREKLGDYEPVEIFEVVSANLGKILDILPLIIKNQKMTYQGKKLKVIFLGSVAGKEDNTYPNHTVYAACKAAISSVCRNLQVEYADDITIGFHLMEIPYTASRMTEGLGDSPDQVRTDLLKLILT